MRDTYCAADDHISLLCASHHVLACMYVFECMFSGLTADTTQETKEACIQIGMRGVLHKVMLKHRIASHRIASHHDYSIACRSCCLSVVNCFKHVDVWIYVAKLSVAKHLGFVCVLIVNQKGT